VISQLSVDEIKFGFVNIDPPFGLLKECDWDVQWVDSYWMEIFSLLSETQPQAPVCVFMSFQMMPKLMEIAAVNGYVETRCISWLKTNKQSNKFGRETYPVNMIVIFSKKKLIWNSGRGGLSANFSSNGNFVATPCFPLYKKDSIIVNVTQKPVHLLRSFIFSLCSEPLPVLDICSGSGSTSIACASLGIDSYSVDIRQSQIDASIHRMNFESIKPRWYPHPSIVHNFSVLDKFLKDSFEEPIPVVIKSPPKKSSKNQKSASQEVSSSHSEEGESSSDDEEDFNIMEESARL
jgi:DNA modification methylase